jgi:cell wall-associated NlpC family hydrolase
MLALAGCAGIKRHPATGAQAVVDGQRRGDVVLTAMGLVDSRYRYGEGHPSRGFDCSGLVAYVFNTAAAQPLPHNSAAIAQMSRPVSRRGLKAGDFVFFNTLDRPFSHMGIYIGDGQFVNAPSSGGRVRVDRLDNPYFAQRFESARTVFND